ncbi:hypothetical protein NQ317_004560 [Molorchus minor]|uniref:Peptidase S1 domain-containing protein n=1 Tax=Molorchus minor TaxID=1323400 RepID=A0ABQ9JX40_9CUCU|nr:hypothetical protein NQ317_004560 [Molorchus minor]
MKTSTSSRHVSKSKTSKVNPNLGIVNGIEVEPHSLPYMAAIRTTINEKTVLCGGSLIISSLVLTAARCLDGATEVEITLGAHNIDESEDGQVTLISTEFIIHPDYDRDSMVNDIALIGLPSDVPFNGNIDRVVLPGRGDVANTYDEELGMVAGWGKSKRYRVY